MSDAERKNVYIASLLERGKWVNIPDDRYGLRLLDGTGAAVRRADGSFFEMGWDDLSNPITRPIYSGGKQTTPTPALPRMK